MFTFHFISLELVKVIFVFLFNHGESAALKKKVWENMYICSWYDGFLGCSKHHLGGIRSFPTTDTCKSKLKLLSFWEVC